MHGGWVEASPLSTSPFVLLFLLHLLRSGLTHVTVCVEQLSGVTIPTVSWGGQTYVVSLLWQALLSSELSS